MISTCIPTYNGECYIEQQLISILSQMGSNDEVIISDDSSTDKTLDIINSINDPRVRMFQGNKYYNPTHNLENALKNNQANYIFLSDQDDIWFPDKASIVLSYLEYGYDLVLHNAQIMEGTLATERLLLQSPRLGLLYNIYDNIFTGCCMAFNKRILDLALPFPERIPMHDWWIGMIGLTYGRIKIIEEPLIYYRKHSGNATNTGSKSQHTLSEKIRFRRNIIIPLIKHRLTRWKC
jgi:glycosyltransferase involved in cell wall biosynthesis